MDIFLVLFLSFVSIFFGIILTLVVQYYVLVRYFQKSPIASVPKKFSTEAYSLPEALKKELESNECYEKSEGTSLPISLLFQFLFHELRHSDRIKRWLYKKLTLEFDELLTKTTIGKFFDAVTIRDMHLGTQFPDIKSVKVEDLKLDKKDGYIETLNLCINLDYTGNFLLSVDGKMKFGKTAYLSIKVKRICGLARLQFTRNPYTHWSFSFYNEPIMDLAVESHFQGRQLQSNITNLIVNQIKKAIKRKHTLPNYKIRYKPFFIKTDPGQLDFEDSEICPQGQLEVTCVEATRLATSADVVNVYCTFTVDVIPYICVYRKDGISYAVIELTMSKVRQQQLGVIFKQEHTNVVIESVTPQTPAARAGLKAGDVLIAVENKIITNVTQLSKLIKAISAVNFSLRIERVAQNYIFKMKTCDKFDEKPTTSGLNVTDDEIEQDTFVIVDNIKQPGDENLEGLKKTKSINNLDKIKNSDKVPKLISASNENMSKFAQTIGNFTLRKRKSSSERMAVNEGNTNKGFSTTSNPSTPQHLPVKHSMTVPTSTLYAKKHSISESTEATKGDAENLEGIFTEIFRGQELSLSSVVTFNDEHIFQLKESSKYLNVNIWGVTPNTKDLLLGYVNIPLSEILNECCSSMLGHYTRTYSFLPPNTTPPNSHTHPLITHSGFEHVFCYGDILLSFLWYNDDPMEIKNKSTDNSCDTEPKPTINVINKHDFIRTQFHRTTHCDFCSKKIWLKDAVQCRECGLCCHKKCISKCQVSTECLPADRSSLKSDISDIVQPEIITTEVCDESNIDGLETKMSISPLKRVNSANNLAIPGQVISSSQTRSLPPTPQRTPSRKQSLVTTNPFSLCASALEEVQKQPDETTECITRLLDHVMSCSTDESLMDAAKETGKQLYANMPNEDKIEKINLMMSVLKKTFDVVTDEHTDLNKQMGIEGSEVEKAKIAFLMGQADAKLHGLSVLMLHYCSGLQQTQEKIV